MMHKKSKHVEAKINLNWKKYMDFHAVPSNCLGKNPDLGIFVVTLTLYKTNWELLGFLLQKKTTIK